MATGGFNDASDEISDFQCFTCTNKAAVKYCIECQGFCCQTCVGTHSRFPALKGHTLLDPLDAKVQGLSITLSMIPTERCAIHTNNLVDMYCKDHDEVCCTTCIALNHRSCTHVHSIPDDISELFDATVQEDMTLYLQSRESRFKNIELKTTEAMKDLESSRKEADMMIDFAKQNLVVHVEKLAKQAKEEVGKEYQATKEQIVKKRQEAVEMTDDIRMKLRDLETLTGGNRSQQFVRMKIENKNLKEEKQMETTLKCNAMTNICISFEIDSRIQAFLQDIKTLGRLSFTRGTRRYTVDTIKDVNVKLQDDKATCDIAGSCLIENGPLLLTDSRNKKLKSVNIETMAVENVYNFGYIPYCLCSTSKDEVAVTFYKHSNFIMFILFTAKPSHARKVNINHNCFGIAYGGDKLYITDKAQTLYIHDMTGNELQKISTDSLGIALFNNIRDISFSDSMQCAVAVDESKGVIMFNDQYQHIARYCDPELQGAAAVCTDDEGNIFVCGYYSHNVLQLGYDGKKIVEVVGKSHGIPSPVSLCFDSSRQRLVVSPQNGRDIVKIIQLMY